MSSLISLLLVSVPLFAVDKIQCLGPAPENAKSFYIFLHGAGLTGVHQSNLRVLKEIAKQKNIRFAIPISKWQCSAGEHEGEPCWLTGPFDENSHKPALEVLRDAAEECFKNHDHGLIGFSAGAALATSIMQHCVPNSFTRLIAVGNGTKTRTTDRAGLKGCNPQLKFLVGEKDPYRVQAKKCYETLKGRDADVTYEEFPGGHEMKLEPLLKLFD